VSESMGVSSNTQRKENGSGPVPCIKVQSNLLHKINAKGITTNDK